MVFREKGTIAWGLAAAAALLLVACTAAPKFATKTQMEAGKFTLRKVYVYAFLDARQPPLSAEYIRQFDRRLGEALTAAGIDHRVLWYKKSPVEAEYVIASKPAGGTLFNPRSTINIPVREVIERNKPAEREFAASHRLLVFPADINTSISYGVETVTTFAIRWDLVDAWNGRVVWTSTSRTLHGGFTVPETIALSEVQGLVNELRSTGLLQ
jgi:hypothetical protein